MISQQKSNSDMQARQVAMEVRPRPLRPQPTIKLSTCTSVSVAKSRLGSKSWNKWQGCTEGCAEGLRVVHCPVRLQQNNWPAEAETIADLKKLNEHLSTRTMQVFRLACMHSSSCGKQLAAVILKSATAAAFLHDSDCAV